MENHNLFTSIFLENKQTHHLIIRPENDSLSWIWLSRFNSKNDWVLRRKWLNIIFWHAGKATDS